MSLYGPERKKMSRKSRNALRSVSVAIVLSVSGGALCAQVPVEDVVSWDPLPIAMAHVVEMVSFAPAASAPYVVTQDNPDDLPLYFVVLDDQYVQIDAVTSGGDGGARYLRFDAEAGKTYYVVAGLVAENDVGGIARFSIGTTVGAGLGYSYGAGKDPAGQFKMDQPPVTGVPDDYSPSGK